MKILKVKDMAALLNVSEKTLYQWAALNQIPHLKINGALRFNADEIEKWLKGCERTPAIGYNKGAQTRSPKKEVF
jgi:excisionase family DNA binding protein